MTSVTYTARRSIIPGHSVNSSYSINIPVVSLEPARRPKTTARQESLNGNRETILLVSFEFYDVQTAIIQSGQVPAIKEFLNSVEAGEIFTFDPYGSANSPVSPMTADIESTGYTMQRAETRGQGGANDGFRFSFQVRTRP